MKEKHIRENTTMFTQLNTRHLSLALALARVTLISDRRRSKLPVKTVVSKNEIDLTIKI